MVLADFNETYKNLQLSPQREPALSFRRFSRNTRRGRFSVLFSSTLGRWEKKIQPTLHFPAFSLQKSSDLFPYRDRLGVSRLSPLSASMVVILTLPCPRRQRPHVITPHATPRRSGRNLAS